jgi:ubiquinone/menaquinone biosynthesis C-methylase UbiE
MAGKPEHLESRFADVFKDQSVVDAYHHRPPYPDEVFELLAGLIDGEPRTVLDVGCGTGEIARRLAPVVDRVDAVDVSERMIRRGGREPGGDAPTLRWILGRAEDVPLQPPYRLVTAAASLHWMEWDVVMPRFVEVLSPGAYLTVVEDVQASMPWSDAVRAACGRYSLNRHYRPYDLIEELTTRDLLEVRGRHRTALVPWRQTLDEYVESFHARNGLSRDRMSPESARAFDAAVRGAVRPYIDDDIVSLQVAARVSWGIPRGRAEELVRMQDSPTPGHH